MTIMHLALSHPDLFGPQVKGVALFSTSAGEMADYSPVRAIPGWAFSKVAPPLLAGLNRVPELVQRGRQAGSDLGYVVTRRMAFGSDVPANLVELTSEMLGETSLEVVADFYPTFSELDEYAAFDVLARVPCAVVGGIDDMITPIEHTDKIIELLPDAAADARGALRAPRADGAPGRLLRGRRGPVRPGPRRAPTLRGWSGDRVLVDPARPVTGGPRG